MEKRTLTRKLSEIFLVGAFTATSLYNAYNKVGFTYFQEQPPINQLQEKQKRNQELREKIHELSPQYKSTEIKLENLA